MSLTETNTNSAHAYNISIDKIFQDTSKLCVGKQSVSRSLPRETHMHTKHRCSVTLTIARIALSPKLNDYYTVYRSQQQQQKMQRLQTIQLAQILIAIIIIGGHYRFFHSGRVSGCLMAEHMENRIQFKFREYWMFTVYRYCLCGMHIVCTLYHRCNQR